MTKKERRRAYIKYAKKELLNNARSKSFILSENAHTIEYLYEKYPEVELVTGLVNHAINTDEEIINSRVYGLLFCAEMCR